MHTVFFNGETDEKHTVMDVRIAVNRDVVVYFELEYPGLSDTASFAEDRWVLPGLTVRLRADAPPPAVVRRGNIVQVCYLSQVSKPETKRMRFELDFSQENGGAEPPFMP